MLTRFITKFQCHRGINRRVPHHVCVTVSERTQIESREREVTSLEVESIRNAHIICVHKNPFTAAYCECPRLWIYYLYTWVLCCISSQRAHTHTHAWPQYE